MGGIVCLYRLYAWRFQQWTLEMQRCLDSVCIACTQGGSKNGPWECHLVFVSAAGGEVPKVDLGNATLSWYRFCLYRLHTGRFQKWTLEMQRCLDSVCIACTQGGSKSGPWACHPVFVSSAQGEVPKVDLGNATLSWYRLFVSSARREVPNVDLGNAALSWYRLYRLHTERFQKWTSGMSLCLRIVCAGGRFQKWILGMFLCLGIVCLYRLHARRFQKWT